MAGYRWDGNRTLVRTAGEDVDPGEEFEPTDSELRHFGDRIVEAPDADDVSEGEEPVAEADESDSEDDEHWEFDAEEWLDVQFETRAEAVRDGDVDEHLDAIEECERSDTVVEAVEERREELEE